MAFGQRVTLRGSDIKAHRHSERAGEVPADAPVTVSVFLRRKSTEPSGPGLTYEERKAQCAANPEDVTLVEQFAREYQLSVVESSAQKRRVVLSGTAAAMSKAFGADFIRCKLRATDRTFRGRTGSLSIPAELADSVIAALGFDERPIARPHFRKRIVRPHAAPGVSYDPPKVAALYNFPAGADGTGQTVGIIELGGGYQTSDIQTYFQQIGLKQPKVTSVSVDGGQNSPGSDADGEVLLDIEVVGSIANGANIAVYFAPNTEQGFVDAITDAVHDATNKPSVISISWGGPEDSWTQQAQTALNSALQDAATLGVTVTAAAGDGGSTDGVGDNKLHADFPASSPYALACGGTTLTASGNQISSEVVWNEAANQEGATGGGVSTVFALPSYQSSAGVPKQPETGFVGRGLPDVAGNADPATGYNVLVDGQMEVVGGTSAVAPLWAALVAILNQKLGSAGGFLNPKLYPLGKKPFRDITSGNNDDSNLGYYSAKAGWDPCTGLGSPNGTALLSALAPKAASSST